MRRLFSMGVVTAGLAVAVPVLAQTPQAPPPATEATRPATTTADGDTGLWYVPTGEVLPHKKFSVSFYRDNINEGQGFANISKFPLTFGVGVGKRAEIFTRIETVTRIDRDARPLFFPSASGEADTGTGGGILLQAPFQRSSWTGNKFGDVWLGAKFNLTSQADQKPVATAIRARVKLPTAGTDDANSVGSGKADFEVDGIVSGRNKAVELSGFGGAIFRGNPDNYKLTNGFRWGVGAGFPQEKSGGFLITTELFGESYFDKTISGPASIVGADDRSGRPTRISRIRWSSISG